MFSNQRWHVVTTLFVLAAILMTSQTVRAGYGFRFDNPILNLIEICPDHMTFGFALAETQFEDSNANVSQLSDPAVVVTAVIFREDNGFSTTTRFEARRIVDENDRPIDKNGATIEVILGSGNLISETIFYAQGDWIDYPGDLEDVLKLQQNQTGYITVEFSPPLAAGAELELKFDVATQDGTPITEGLYNAEEGVAAGLSMRVPTDCASENLVQNPSFEDAKNHWLFFTNGQGRFTTAAPASEGDRAARVEITQSGSNVQLYQRNMSLDPNTPYELRFDATSNSGHNLRVYMHKHGAPYTNYGLRGTWVDLRSGYQTFTISFTTTNFASPVTDARLRFWFAPYAQPGDIYMIDNVRLIKASEVAAAGLAEESADPNGEVFVEEDDAGLLAGGPVPEDDAAFPTQHLFLPLVTR